MGDIFFREALGLSELYVFPLENLTLDLEDVRGQYPYSIGPRTVGLPKLKTLRLALCHRLGSIGELLLKPSNLNDILGVMQMPSLSQFTFFMEFMMEYEDPSDWLSLPTTAPSLYRAVTSLDVASDYDFTEDVTKTFLQLFPNVCDLTLDVPELSPFLKSSVYMNLSNPRLLVLPETQYLLCKDTPELLRRFTARPENVLFKCHDDLESPEDEHCSSDYSSQDEDSHDDEDDDIEDDDEDDG